jgi:metallo-beta-lactamase family protein
MAFYTSFGAAGEVTGSCHLLEIGHIKILIDCGMFQGEEEELNFKPFPFDPKDINYLIVTHAHLDHIGRIPLLVKEGFDKKIITTKATYSIAKLMLKNAAGILETKEKKLYTVNDVEPALKLFDTFVEFNNTIVLEENIRITFKSAGHILGSATVKVEFLDEGIEKSVIFSGDIGQDERIITIPIDHWKKANYLFTESTYGASLHQELSISIEDFKKQILKTVKKQGVVVIPSFAVERTQEILYLLRQMSLEGLLKNVPVYLDSPLAINVTKTFLDFPQLFNEEIKDIINKGENPFDFEELENTYTKEASQQINEKEGAKIIIAGSGMCEGGRVNYHLVRYLGNPDNLALFVGFQVNSTLGRKISRGDRELKILGTPVTVRAKIHTVQGFSAHADQKNILNWINNIKGLYCIYLIHGEHPQLDILKKKVKNELKEKVHIVDMSERIHI